MTTRIRINIPGSRPIPPVVVRTPVEEGHAAARQDAGAAASGPSAGPAPEPPAGAAVPPPPSPPAGREAGPGGDDRKTSSWFAPRRPPAGQPPAAPAAQSAPGAPQPGGQRSQPPYFPDGPGAPAQGRNEPQPDGLGAGPEPDGPTTGPAPGEIPGLRPGASLLPPAFQQPAQSPAPVASDDTRRLTPQPPAPSEERRPRPPGAVGGSVGVPVPEEPSGPGPDHVSGDTLVSGIAVVPQSRGTSFPGAAGGASAPRRPRSPASKRSGRGAPAKQGRSKLVVVGVAVVGVIGVAYGAGLLLDHAEVPNGTTVLGTDIGGTSKEEAVDKLERALAGRTSEPMKVTVHGDERQLKPSIAGLRLETETTVRNAAGRDYNPVSVIASLFGGTREAEPAIKVDTEKLTAALKTLAGEAGGSKDGTIKFMPGKAVAVPGRTHQALNVDKSLAAVTSAFREQAATGRAVAVALPSSKQRPTVSQAEIARKMKSFAEPAMSGLVTIKAGTKVIQFGPDKSLPKILSMRVVDGRLVERYDLQVVKQLYGSVFDGVLIQRGNGSKTPVTPQDVITAMGPALLKTNPAERVGVIPVKGN